MFPSKSVLRILCFIALLKSHVFLDGTTSNRCIAATPGSWRGQSITEFTQKENADFSWQVVNDGVMGGRSKGNLEFTPEDTMHFSGTLSLENNGGFSTARSGPIDYDLSNDLGLLLLVKGDGRTYEARLDSTAKHRGNTLSFAGEFQTKAKEWVQVKIPFSEFTGSWRGRTFPDAKLDTAKINRLWILLADKQAGPFDLQVKWIRTYGKGQGRIEPPTSASSPSTEKQKNEERKRIIPTLEADGRFTEFKKALDVARLTTFFQWDNPLTVFAPTDEAFAALPDGLLEALHEPAMREKLVELLSHHVVPGEIALDKTMRAKTLKAVRGGHLIVSEDQRIIRVNAAKFLPPSIPCKDGIIHPIDVVLLPSSD